jgi:hypothetical protein
MLEREGDLKTPLFQQSIHTAKAVSIHRLTFFLSSSRDAGIVFILQLSGKSRFFPTRA